MSIFKSNKGFTLAELLIALAILGVIATFTIPKILSSSANGQNTAIAKEAASMISGAYSTYTMNNGVASTMTGTMLTQYMNYVSEDTTSTYVPATQAANGLAPCTATLPCLKLHNGGVLQYDTAQTMGGTNGLYSLWFKVDPDGSGTQAAVTFVQFAGGRLTTGTNSTGSLHGVAGTLLTSPDPTYLANWN